MRFDLEHAGGVSYYTLCRRWNRKFMDVTLANINHPLRDAKVSPDEGIPRAAVNGTPTDVASPSVVVGIDGVSPNSDAIVIDSPPRKRSRWERIEAYISKLSTRNWFWHKVCSLIWLPYAFRSGISLKRLDNRRFRAVLPFKRVNRNWYNAMAGAALLGNSEVAAGLFLFGEIGGDYIVVCKDMKYRFLRPCLGPAVYEIVNSEDLKAKVATGGEFNIELQMEIRQQLKQKGRELRVGKCDITFHCTPKAMLKAKKDRRKNID